MNQNQNRRTQKKHFRASRRASRIAALMQTAVFFFAMLFFAVLGCLLPFRPKISNLEKRTLTKFPKFSLSSFWDGTFLANVDTWYADTFPLREQLLAANASLSGLHGLQSETVVSGEGDKRGEEIPTGENADAGAAVQADDNDGAATETPVTQAPADGSIHDGVPETFGDVYITGGRAFEAFYFVQDYANRYCKLINTLQAKVGDQVTVYALAAPVNAGIILDDKMQEELGFSDEKAATEYIYNNLDERVKTVPVFDNIKSHNSEYVYYRTDHHWTTLGAYYAYEEFAKVKGFEPHPLDMFEKKEFDGFLGTFYSDSQSPVLKENADTVTAYIPAGTNSITITERNGNVMDWKIIEDVSEYQANNLYSAFVGGDNPYSEIHNPQITDGSNCLIIRESYANCFIPFLVDHYQDIYMIDYRYYQDDLMKLIADKGIKEVVFLNNLNAIFADPLLQRMERVVMP